METWFFVLHHTALSPHMATPPQVRRLQVTREYCQEGCEALVQGARRASRKSRLAWAFF